MYLPAVALMIVFVIYPLIQGVHISLTNWNGYSQTYKYVGLQNYRKLFTDVMFHTSFRNTLVYGFGSALIQTGLGLLYALLLQDRFCGRTFARTVIYIPVMVSQLIAGYIWYFMVQYDQGALNDIMLLLGAEPLDWMAQGARAVVIITLINGVQYVGKTMIIFIAGLNGIPTDYYEAASLDGAGAWQKFRYITLPQLLPALATNIILNLIGGLKLFGIVVSMTGGGPGYASHSLQTLINYTYFENQSAGYSAAIGLFTFVSVSYTHLTLPTNSLV